MKRHLAYQPHIISVKLLNFKNYLSRDNFYNAYLLAGIFFLFILTVSPIGAYGQSRQELEKERRQKLEEIRQTKSQLREVSAKQKQSIEYLQLLQKQISYRQSLMETLESELILVNISIAQSSDIVASLQNDLDALRQEYARLIYYYYKSRGQYGLLAYIFSSSSFHEAFSRVKLIRFYSQYRAKQMQLISKTQASLIEKMTGLRKKQLEKQQVLAVMDDQKKELENDKHDQNILIDNLRHQGGELQKELKEKVQAAEKLDKAIKQAILKEIALARQRERELARAQRNKRHEAAPTQKEEDMPLSPEAKLQSDKFAANKGHLPWPVERGSICERFGRQPHPSLPGIFVNNNGSRICTSRNAMARAIFEGEVRAILPIDAQRKFVLIKHGDYFTVYSNLKIVLVKPGQKVSTRQEIGVISQDPEDKRTELELQIWKGGSTKLNPENWIAR
jgi:septal ring factor EnvC (AmiA/AmiB activator)